MDLSSRRCRPPELDGQVGLDALAVSCTLRRYNPDLDGKGTGQLTVNEKAIVGAEHRLFRVAPCQQPCHVLMNRAALVRSLPFVAILPKNSRLVPGMVRGLAQARHNLLAGWKVVQECKSSRSNRKKLQAGHGVIRLDRRWKHHHIMARRHSCQSVFPAKEVDNFLFLSKELQKLGYACSSEDAAAYVPLKDRPGSSYGDSSSHHLHDSS